MAATNREEMLNLIPAYAVGALDESERAELEAWLTTDPEAQSILADYRAVADHLVALAPLREAPAHLQADLRRRLAADHRDGRSGPSVEYVPQQHMRGALRRPRVWRLVAAVLLVVVTVGVMLAVIQSDDYPDPATSAAAQLYAELMDQPGSSRYEVVPGEVNEGVWGNMLVSSDGKQAVLCVWDLPEISDEQTFQVWLIGGGGERISGGIFQADPTEKAIFIEVPFDLPASAYQGVGVSLEPAGGSPYIDEPSGPRVLSVPLS